MRIAKDSLGYVVRAKFREKARLGHAQPFRKRSLGRAHTIPVRLKELIEHFNTRLQAIGKPPLRADQVLALRAAVKCVANGASPYLAIGFGEWVIATGLPGHAQFTRMPHQVHPPC